MSLLLCLALVEHKELELMVSILFSLVQKWVSLKFFWVEIANHIQSNAYVRHRKQLRYLCCYILGKVPCLCIYSAYHSSGIVLLHQRKP